MIFKCMLMDEILCIYGEDDNTSLLDLMLLLMHIDGLLLIDDMFFPMMRRL